MNFKKWLVISEQPIGPPTDGVTPTLENPANGGVGAFPTYSKDENPPTPRCDKRMRRRMKKR